MHGDVRFAMRATSMMEVLHPGTTQELICRQLSKKKRSSVKDLVQVDIDDVISYFALAAQACARGLLHLPVPLRRFCIIRVLKLCYRCSVR